LKGIAGIVTKKASEIKACRERLNFYNFLKINTINKNKLRFKGS
jgi:hypothetical protein